MSDNGVYTGISGPVEEPVEEIQPEVAEQIETEKILKSSDLRIKAIIKTEREAVASIADVADDVAVDTKAEVRARKRYLYFLTRLDELIGE